VPVNKSELAEKLAQKADLSMKDAKSIIGVLFDTDPRSGIIAGELKRGRKVQITGFGTFEPRNRKKRKGRNPQTGAEILIPAAKVPAFAAGKSLKDRINNR
jgi:DNA-binding protein HU-beta